MSNTIVPSHNLSSQRARSHRPCIDGAVFTVACTPQVAYNFKAHYAAAIYGGFTEYAGACDYKGCQMM